MALSAELRVKDDFPGIWGFCTVPLGLRPKAPPLASAQGSWLENLVFHTFL